MQFMYIRIIDDKGKKQRSIENFEVEDFDSFSDILRIHHTEIKYRDLLIIDCIIKTNSSVWHRVKSKLNKIANGKNINNSVITLSKRRIKFANTAEFTFVL